MEAGEEALSSPTEIEFPLRRPSKVRIAERRSPARVRCAALPRALACSAPFGSSNIRDGRLRRKLETDFLLTKNARSWKTECSSGSDPEPRLRLGVEKASDNRFVTAG